MNGVVVRVILGVEDLDGALFSDPVADLTRIDPDGKVGWKILDDVRNRISGFASCPVQYGIGWVGDLEASVG